MEDRPAKAGARYTERPPAVVDSGRDRLLDRLPRRARAEAVEQVVTDAEGVSHRRQGRVHRTRRGEEARVDDVEVVEVVRLAVDVQRRGLRIGAEPHRAA